MKKKKQLDTYIVYVRHGRGGEGGERDSLQLKTEKVSGVFTPFLLKIDKSILFTSTAKYQQL